MSFEILKIENGKAYIMGYKGFDPEEIIKQVNVSNINISVACHTGALPKFCDTIDDFSFLNRLNVEHLSISNCRFFNNYQLNSICRNKNLKTFELKSFMPTVTDFSPLSRVDCLQSVRLTDYIYYHKDVEIVMNSIQEFKSKFSGNVCT